MMNRTSVLRVIWMLCAHMAARQVAIGAASDAAAFATRAQRLDVIVGKQIKELGIPGLSIAVADKDGTFQVNGYGFRDVDRKLPVTADSLFGIGSCTKAFTGVAAVLSAESGKLSLDDSPKKFLPYFHLIDPVADSKATLLDLLTHRTGLTAYDDEVWHKDDKLSREEVIKAVVSKPATAKFRTTFQYNNVMYSAVGECIGKANNSTWQGVISNQIFGPLGMKRSNTSLQEMRAADDSTVGYHLPAAHPIPEKTHDLDNVAASGAINSSARDLARWIHFMLNGGIMDGQRVISESGFRQLITPVNGHYALGWEAIDMDGHKTLISEGGAVGHAARITIDLDAGIGWAVLANVNNVREFRQVATTVDLSLRSQPQLSRWNWVVNLVTVLLWVTLLGLGATAISSRRREVISAASGDNLKRHAWLWSGSTIPTLAAVLIGVFAIVLKLLSAKPWMVVHMPALEWVQWGAFCCGLAMLLSCCDHRMRIAKHIKRIGMVPLQ